MVVGRDMGVKVLKCRTGNHATIAHIKTDSSSLFTKGTSEDKMRIIFDMCDKDEKSVVDKKELKEILTSLIEIAKTEKILDDDVSILINSMFKSAGLEDKPIIDYGDFQQLMKEFNLDYLTVGLDFKAIIIREIFPKTNILISGCSAKLS